MTREEELREIVLKASDDKSNFKDLGIGSEKSAVCGFEFVNNSVASGSSGSSDSGSGSVGTSTSTTVEGRESKRENTFDFDELMKNYKNIGFQASNLGVAIDIVKEMIAERNKFIIKDTTTTTTTAPIDEEKERGCKIFLGYTSNLVSSGLRDMLRFLTQTNQVDVIVSSAGGIEEDFIKCLGDTYLGSFTLDGAMLRSRGLNRIGNLLVPNSNYCKFEDWILPILDQLLLEQKRDGITWTPSSIIKRLGREINHPASIYYWAYKNDIPVYCPALTDGSLGDMIYFHSFKNPGLVIDIAADIRSMNGMCKAMCILYIQMMMMADIFSSCVKICRSSCFCKKDGDAYIRWRSHQASYM